MNLSMRQLKLFEAICRCHSLTDAAEEQAISQSAASQSLKELEKQLGYSLFRKTGRTLTLTEAGSLALPKVRQVLANLDSLRFPSEQFVGGVLNVSASETIASYLMPQLLADFVARFPKVEPHLNIDNTERVVQHVENSQASVGFIEGPAYSSGTRQELWLEDQLIVFAGPDFHWSSRKNIPSGELAAQPWIVREPGSGTRAVFDHAFQQRQETPRIKLALSRQEAIKQSARAGLGVGCLSQLSVVDELASGVLVPLETSLNLTRRFSLLSLKEAAPTALVKEFLQFARHWKP
ncbi:LysR family transcriptional regulator [Reinekea sp.]|jgi:DNA-binding transcriptional LysR family regulator|uniref:LysR family transcriptional regulator n=1 Tax=Reinekea sp. TaxID=1970455 RepID=UPI00398A20FD